MKGCLQGIAGFFTGLLVLALWGVGTIAGGWTGFVIGKQFDSLLITIVGVIVGAIVGFLLAWIMGIILTKVVDKIGLTDGLTDSFLNTSSSSSSNSYSSDSSSCAGLPYMYQHDAGLGSSKLSWTATHVTETVKCSKCGKVFSETRPR
jgi:mannitol-specific phosphotransferase system IIBC component